jgi:integrase
LLKKCKIRSRPFHTLRHTFATRALEIGADAKTVSELLGHSSAAFTLNRYAHSLTEYKIKVMNRLGGLLAGQTKNPVNAMRVRGSPTEKPLRLITD